MSSLRLAYLLSMSCTVYILSSRVYVLSISSISYQYLIHLLLMTHLYIIYVSFTSYLCLVYVRSEPCQCLVIVLATDGQTDGQTN